MNNADKLRKVLGRLPKMRLGPLHQRLRPKTLDDYVGHEDFRGEKKILQKLLALPEIPPLFLLGPPGVGKTSYARMIGKKEGYRYVEVNVAWKDLEVLRRELSESVRIFETTGQRTIFFLDEIDRVPEEEQEMFLPHIDKGGAISLIAASPKNPKKILTPELLKKFRYLVLQKHEEADLRTILDRALADNKRAFGGKKIVINEDGKKHLIRASNGNARDMLRMLDWALSHIKLGLSPRQNRGTTPGTFVIDKALLSLVEDRLIARNEQRKKYALAREAEEKRKKESSTIPDSAASAPRPPSRPPAKK